MGATEITEFVDDGVSGATLDRPALHSLRDAVGSGVINTVITYDPDRLSRDLVHLLLLADEFEARHAELIFLTMDWQKTPEGRLFLSMRGAVAEFERQKIRERMLRGKRQKVLQGGIGQPPTRMYGYRYADGKMNIVLGEAEAVKRIFALATDGLGCHRIVKRLAEEGYRPLISTKWHHVTVMRILRNPAYMGHLRQLYKGKVMHDGFTVEIPAIVTPEQFATAQAIMDEHSRNNPGRSGIGTRNLLSGLLRCGACNKKVYTNGGYRLKQPDGYAYYVCSSHVTWTYPRTVKPCENKAFPSNRVDEAVWQAALDMLDEPDDLWQARLSRVQYEDANAATKGRLEKEIADYKNSRERVLALVVRGTISQDDADRALLDTNLALKRAQKVLAALNRVGPAKGPWGDDPASHLRSLREQGRAAITVEERRSVVRALVREVMLYPDRRIEMVPTLARVEPILSSLDTASAS